MNCDEYIQRRVKLGYVADAPTSVQLVDSIGNQVFDLLPIIQAGETDTSIALLADTRRIRYYPEKWTRTEGHDGCFYDICIPDIAALIDLGELRNVTDSAPTNGSTIVYNTTTGQYEIFDLAGALSGINSSITNLGDLISALTNRVTTLENKILEQNLKIQNLTELVGDYLARIVAIENTIYNWASDKTTKIPRGTINITSGGPTSNYIIQSREKNQDNDLDFQ